MGDRNLVDLRPLGRTGLSVSPLGFGAFKIGRNVGIKYPSGYELPDEDEVRRLLDAVLDLGINLIDTAPAYGLSEERIGRALAARRDEFILSTKVGETFEDGRSTHDFSRAGVTRSLERSLQRLRTDRVDLTLVHSDGDDLEILDATDVVETLHDLRDRGLTRLIGFSGKTLEGARSAMRWADALMVTYHARDASHRPVIDEARERGSGILVKKGLASGHLPPEEAIPFVLKTPGVASLVVGGLNPEHLRQNTALASAASA